MYILFWSGDSNVVQETPERWRGGALQVGEEHRSGQRTYKHGRLIVTSAAPVMGAGMQFMNLH